MTALALPSAAPARVLLRDDALSRARWLGRAAALLVVASEFKLRTRDASAALAAEADGQVYIELAAYLAVGALLLLRRTATALLRRQGAARGSLALAAGSPLQVMRALALLAMVSSFWSPTTIAPVRALQLIICVELAVDAATTCRTSAAAGEEFVGRLRSTLLLAVGLATLATAVVPGFSFARHEVVGSARFRLLAMHPIATGIVLSVTALLVLRPALQECAARGMAALRQGSTAGSLLAGAFLVLGVVATRERAVVISLLLALLVLARLLTDSRQRQLLITAALAVLAVAILTLLDPVTTYLRRGQSTEQLATLSGRLDLFHVARQLFVEQPVLGHGYLSGRSVFLPYLSWAGESHNLLVEILVSSGLIGLLLFGFLAGRALLALRRQLGTPETGRYALGVDAACLLVLLTLLGATTDGVAGPPRLQVIALCSALALIEPAVASGAGRAAALRRPPRGHRSAASSYPPVSRP